MSMQPEQSEFITLRSDALPRLASGIAVQMSILLNRDITGSAYDALRHRITAAIIAAGVECGVECPQGGPHEDACSRLAMSNPPLPASAGTAKEHAGRPHSWMFLQYGKADECFYRCGCGESLMLSDPIDYLIEVAQVRLTTGTVGLATWLEDAVLQEIGLDATTARRIRLLVESRTGWEPRRNPGPPIPDAPKPAVSNDCSKCGCERHYGRCQNDGCDEPPKFAAASNEPATDLLTTPPYKRPDEIEAYRHGFRDGQRGRSDAPKPIVRAKVGDCASLCGCGPDTNYHEGSCVPLGEEIVEIVSELPCVATETEADHEAASPLGAIIREELNRG